MNNNNTNNTNNINNIPNEIFDHIITYLHKDDRIHPLCLVSKTFYNAHLYRMKIGRISITTRYKDSYRDWS